MELIFSTMVIGVSATALLDGYMLARQALAGIRFPDYALVGRWIGSMARGQFLHEAIARSPAVRGERFTGWLFHYVTGIAFAGMLIALAGQGWLARPTPGPALLVGLATVAAPFLLMQPGMGAGFAASRTPNPRAARIQSLITHGVFGLCLYLAALLAAFMPQLQ